VLVLAAIMAPSKYFAYHVTLRGLTVASYELQTTDDEAAKMEARYFLKFYPTIEVWQGARFIARFMAEEPTAIKEH